MENIKNALRIIECFGKEVPGLNRLQKGFLQQDAKRARFDDVLFLAKEITPLYFAEDMKRFSAGYFRDKTS